MRSFLILPGRGSYTERSLGSLPEGHEWVATADRLRAERDLPSLVELDRAERFSAALHLRPANVSALIYLVSMLDATEAMARTRPTAVAGNSMGWYTALAAAGAEYRGTIPLPGTDLIAQLDNGVEDERTLFFEHQECRAIRKGDWKLVAFKDAPWELYDFTIDRTELNDLSAAHPELVNELEAAWDQWANENNVTPLPRDLKVPYLKADP